MIDPPRTPAEDDLAAWLSACDEVLASSGLASVGNAAGDSSELPPRLARDLDCIRLLRSLWSESTASADAAGATENSAALFANSLRRIGRFEIRRELGAGGYGIVFLAFDPQLGREVALKIPRAGALTTAALRSRFAYEARVAAGLDHPNIVSVYDAGEIGPVCFIASAYCPGITLAKWLQQRKEPVPFDVAARLVACLADGVHHAHSRGVLHRDLKPANVILAPNEAAQNGTTYDGEAQEFVPRLTDFGLAKMYDASQEAATRTHAVLGTAEYMSPEQAGGKSRDITIAADVYGLGVILYELIAGRPPLRGETPLATLRMVEAEEPPPLSRLRPHTPRDLETIAHKCLQKDPANRYATAHAMAKDLRHFLADEPVKARPTGRAERIARWCRRNRVEAALLFAVSMALVTGTCVSTYFAIQASGRKQAEIQAAVAGVEAREAQAANRRSQQHLYLSRMLVAESAWDYGEMQRLEELLQSVIPRHDADVDYRNFEWYYWQRAIHTNLHTLPFDGPIYTVRFSPNGTQLAVAGERGTAWIVDAMTGERRHVLTGHTGPIWAVAFSANGEYVATASDDTTVRIWDTATGAVSFVLKGHTADVTDVAFAPHGLRLASAAEDGTVRVWDMADGSQLLTYRGHSGPVWSVIFSKDGERILSGGDDDLHIWSSQTGDFERTLTGHDGPVYAADITADGERIATASEDRSVRLWNFAGGESVTVLRGHQAGVRFVEFSPDGERLVSCGRDGVLRFWDARTGRELFDLKGHQHFVDMVTFSPDGRRIASGSRDGSVKLWGANAPRQPTSFDDHQGTADCAEFSSDGRRLASLGRHDQRLIIRDVETGRVLYRRRGAWASESGIAFHPHGRVLAMPQADHAICLYNVDTGDCAQKLFGHNVRVRDVAFSRNGTFLVSSDDDGSIWLWDLLHDGVGRELIALSAPVYAIAVSPDDCSLVATGPGNVATVFEIAAPQLRFTLAGHMGEVYSVAFSADGSRIATASHDTTARIWNARDGRPLMTLTGHTNVAHGVAFTPDGSRLAAGYLSGQIKLWDTATGQEVLTLKGHALGIQTVAFSPDGNLLLSAGMEGSVKLWDARPLEEIK